VVHLDVVFSDLLPTQNMLTDYLNRLKITCMLMRYRIKIIIVS